MDRILVAGASMTLGVAERQGDLLDPVVRFCDGQVAHDSIYGLLHRERDRLFPDELFADLYTDRGRRSIPPSILACVLVLQRLEGLSDREAADRFTFDARWRYACGVGGWETGPVSFVHTVLVRFRMRLEASDDPRRIFRVTTRVAAEAGLVGARRVLDSAPLFDAVATMDTVTLIRSAIRGLLGAADAQLAAELRAVLSGEVDYAGAGKPACDWDDEASRVALIDRLARDGLTLLGVLEGRQLAGKVAEAAQLVALVIGQDLEPDADGTWRIARRVARDRIISTVDPDARHGHKTAARRFDGYKGHVAIDPDAEIITDTAVGPANGGDADMTDILTRDLDPDTDHDTDTDRDGDGANLDRGVDDGGEPEGAEAAGGLAPAGSDDTGSDDTGDREDDGGVADRSPTGAATIDDAEDEGARPKVYGDAAYGSGDNLAELAQRDIDAMVKVQPPAPRGGRFTKDDFTIDLAADTVTCPAGQTVTIRRRDDRSGVARFAPWCAGCPLRTRCTDAAAGRSVSIHRHEALLAEARRRQQDPAWQADYRATRPKVERKLAHAMRRGRTARRRGRAKVDADFNLLGSGLNLARLATLGVRHLAGRWQTAPA